MNECYDFNYVWLSDFSFILSKIATFGQNVFLSGFLDVCVHNTVVISGWTGGSENEKTIVWKHHHSGRSILWFPQNRRNRQQVWSKRTSISKQALEPILWRKNETGNYSIPSVFIQVFGRSPPIKLGLLVTCANDCSVNNRLLGTN